MPHLWVSTEGLRCAMIWLWVLTVVLLALAVVALISYERATDLSGRVAAGVGAMVLGVLGLVMLAALVFGN